jgi:FPC/CPF motif-containing protein YcgG
MSTLLDSATIADPAVTPDWVRAAYHSYRKEISDPAFPCYFGTKAEQQGHMRYLYADDDQRDNLPAAVADFVRFSRDNPRRRHVLIVFLRGPGSDTPFTTDEERFWQFLAELHESDPEPWPADVPSDPDDPRWEFCFAGDPMFAFPSIPSYQRRRSRRIGDGFAVCFQPRRVFFGVGRDDPGGIRIRHEIYDRVRRWDSIPPHPALEPLAYGDTEMREWRQYVLPDGNVPLLDRCPLTTGSASTRAAARPACPVSGPVLTT